ncbi:hypothetical protein [Robbsia sp. KACC 23696]|uniref:hypothetical protein n=1 Tax=Robbsia sp. KACC 23696 TaxID=3149231 RepID=UPI00325BBF4C
MEDPRLVLNRVVVVVLPRAPLVKWINDVGPAQAGVVTLEDAREDPTSLLVPVRRDDLDERGQKWLRLNWRFVFEQTLHDWYVDEAMWPRSRTKKMFEEWIEVRMHSIVLDCSRLTLEYDEDDTN